MRGDAATSSSVGAPLVGALVLAAWLGAALYFAAVVARAAFAALPTRTLAGALVGHTLPALFVSGIVAGLIVAGLALAGASSAPAHGWRLWGGTGVAALCAVAQYGVVTRIDRMRAGLASDLATLPASDPVRVAFGRLHAASVGLLGVAMLLALVVIACTAVALVRE